MADIEQIYATCTECGRPTIAFRDDWDYHAEMGGPHPCKEPDCDGHLKMLDPGRPARPYEIQEGAC